jgi:hypothetical protein
MKSLDVILEVCMLALKIEFINMVYKRNEEKRLEALGKIDILSLRVSVSQLADKLSKEF